MSTTKTPNVSRSECLQPSPKGSLLSQHGLRGTKLLCLLGTIFRNIAVHVPWWKRGTAVTSENIELGNDSSLALSWEFFFCWAGFVWCALFCKPIFCWGLSDWQTWRSLFFFFLSILGTTFQSAPLFFEEPVACSMSGGCYKRLQKHTLRGCPCPAVQNCQFYCNHGWQLCYSAWGGR